VRLHCFSSGPLPPSRTERTVRTNVLFRHRGPAHRLAVVPGDPSRFASCGEDGVVVLYDLRLPKGSMARPLLTVVQRPAKEEEEEEDDSDDGGGGGGGARGRRRRDEAPLGLYTLDFCPTNPNLLLVAGQDSVVRVVDIRHVDRGALVSFCPLRPGYCGVMDRRRTVRAMRRALTRQRRKEREAKAAAVSSAAASAPSQEGKKRKLQTPTASGPSAGTAAKRGRKGQSRTDREEEDEDGEEDEDEDQTTEHSHSRDSDSDSDDSGDDYDSDDWSVATAEAVDDPRLMFPPRPRAGHFVSPFLDSPAWMCAGIPHVTGAVWSADGTRIVATYNDEAAYVFTLAPNPVTGARSSVLYTERGGSDGGGGEEEEDDAARVRIRPGLVSRAQGAPPPPQQQQQQQQQQQHHEQPRPTVAGSAPAAPPSADTPSPIPNAEPLDPYGPLLSDGSRFDLRRGEPGLGTYSRRLGWHKNRDTIKGVAVAGPDSRYVLSGCDNKRLYVYDTAGGDRVEFVEGRTVAFYFADKIGAVNCISPHPGGGPFLLSSGLDEDAKLWAPGVRDTAMERGVAEMNRMLDFRALRRARALRGEVVPQARDEDVEGGKEDEEEDEGVEEEDEDDDDDDGSTSASEEVDLRLRKLAIKFTADRKAEDAETPVLGRLRGLFTAPMLEAIPAVTRWRMVERDEWHNNSGGSGGARASDNNEDEFWDDDDDDDDEEEGGEDDEGDDEEDEEEDEDEDEEEEEQTTPIF
jgi:hypothetical protein